MRIIGRLLFAIFVSFSIVSFVNAQTTTDTTRNNGRNNGSTNNGTNNNPDATGGAVRTPNQNPPAPGSSTTPGTNNPGTNNPGTTAPGAPGTTAPGSTIPAPGSVPAPGSSTAAPSGAAAAVEQASNNFMQAINRGDAAAAAGFYADDAILMPPDIDMIQGANGIKNFWAKVITVGGKFDTLTTSKVNVNSTTVDEIGRYFLTINRPGQEPSQEKGKFVFVWKLQPDDTWKITTHMWNRNRQ